MLSIDTFTRITKFKSKNIDPETGERYYSELPKSEQIELVRVEEGNGNYHNKIIVHQNNDYKRR